MAGGSTAGGSTAGGSTAGGSTAGGSTAGGSTAGGSAGTVFVATLSGSREVPANASTATGSATVTLNAAETSITWTVTHTVASATNAHIHNGLAYTTGGVAVGLGTTFTSPITGTGAVTPTQAADLKAGRMYVNIHSGTFPAGEIRGQLLRPGELLYRTTMSGANEVPPVTTTATGGMQVIFNTAGTQMNCEGTYMGLSPTAAHIHVGAAGASGGVAHALTIPAGATTLTCTNSSISATDRSNAAGGLWYVNVHTQANPGGEIRGQLSAP
jgi:hypothetical protein